MMSQYPHKVPWWWSLVRWCPLIQRARKLGHDEHCVATAVFFRNRAVQNKDEMIRKLYDSWADFFYEQIKYRESNAK